MLKFKIALVLFVLEKNYGDSKIKVFIVVCFFNTKMLTVKKRKEKEEVERRAFNYLLKDEENPKLCYFYYSYYLYMKKYVDNKIILLLFCYCVYNKAYGKYLSYIQVIFNKKLRKRETRYRINPSERPQ